MHLLNIEYMKFSDVAVNFALRESERQRQALTPMSPSREQVEASYSVRERV